MTLYTENLEIDENPLYTAFKNAAKTKDTIYHKRPECDDPEWEGEWARVQRRRAEGHPLMKGGRCKSR